MLTVDTGKFTRLINQRFNRAYSCALAAFGAKSFDKSDLRVRGNTFRIAAPLARKAASFQEHYGSYARSVMDRVPLNICDQIGHKSFS
jgi:hypothetical protein